MSCLGLTPDQHVVAEMSNNELEAAICDFGLAVTLMRHPAENPATPKTKASLKRAHSRVHREMCVTGHSTHSGHLANLAHAPHEHIAKTMRADGCSGSISQQHAGLPTCNAERSLYLRRGSEGKVASNDLQHKSSKLEEVLSNWTLNPAKSSTDSVGTSCVPGSRRGSSRQMATEYFQLTGRIGTFTYMAPEITLCRPYNEKVWQIAPQ